MPDPQDSKPKALGQPKTPLQIPEYDEHVAPEDSQADSPPPAPASDVPKPQELGQPLPVSGFSPPQPIAQKDEFQTPKPDREDKPEEGLEIPPQPTPEDLSQEKPELDTVPVESKLDEPKFTPQPPKPEIPPPIPSVEQKPAVAPPTPPVEPPSETPPPVEPGPQFPPPESESPELEPLKKAQKLKKILIPIILALVALVTGILAVKVLLPRLQRVSLPGMPGKEAELVYWGLWESSSIMEQMIADFNQENPNIKVNYVQQSHKDYRERLQSALARGEGPDIFRFHNTWVPMLQEELDAVPASAYNASKFQETFFPVAAKDLRRGASFVGIPLEIDGLALFYNKRIFEAAGKSPPITWDELRKTAFDLTIRDESGRIKTAGVALGTTNNIDHWSDILGLMMLQNGVDLSSPTDKPAADALLFYTIFARSDKVWNNSLPSSTQAFASGNLAMYFGPSWRVLDFKAINPSLEFGVIPVPQLPNSNITWASYWVEGVSKTSENKDAAWEFINYLSSKAALEKMYAAALAERPIGEPYSRMEMAPLLENDPFIGAFVKQASAAQSWYLASATHDNGINDGIIKYFEDAVNAVNQKQDPQDALTTAAQGTSQILGRYRAK